MIEERKCILRRVSVVGGCASGKTTLAARMAEALTIPHVELDRLAWTAGWQPVSPVALRKRIAAVVREESWIADGNCDVARDLIWSRATSVIWLNYAQPVVLFRALRRSMHRLMAGSTAPTGDKETLRHIVASPHSAVLHVLTRHSLRRRRLRAETRQVSERGVPCITLCTPADAIRLLRCLPLCAAGRCTEVGRCAAFM